jgi:hypothetical protein
MTEVDLIIQLNQAHKYYFQNRFKEKPEHFYDVRRDSFDRQNASTLQSRHQNRIAQIGGHHVADAGNWFPGSEVLYLTLPKVVLILLRRIHYIN